ncbi:MAG: hypothetical protein AB1668_01305, partial [Nanoarchaeota archaeon]
SGQTAKIGKGYNYFNGTIDDVVIWNKALSAEQVVALYNNRTDLIVSQETTAGDGWNVSVTPNDGIEDGVTVFSNNVTIVSNTLPSAPALVSPANNSNITNRTSPFIWNNSADVDGDTLTYNIVIDDNPTFNNPEVNVTNINPTNSVNTTYDLTTELSVDTRYYWMVRANDSTGYGAYSQMFNFTLQSYLALTATVSSVNFGSHQPGDSNNTTTNNPPPFKVENTGNIFVNVTVTGTQYFTTGGFPSNNFQYNISVSEEGAYDLTNSTKRWTNVTSTSTIVDVAFLDWHTVYDDFLMHLLIGVPEDEPPGDLSSTITFTGNS